MLTTTRRVLPALLLATLALPACGEDSGSTDGGGGSAASEKSAEVPVTEVDRSQLPDWIPDDLPMPVGEFVTANRYECEFVCDYGHSLMFMVDDMGRADTLVEALITYGHRQTDVNDDFDGRHRKVWFTEGPQVRANVVVEKYDYGIQVDYNVEPVEG
ncbi:hypothetical protein [Nocardioides sp. J54]|uniref:hypothetical protein n=1 Tax=Nocardioides sp. J54 TaxID=935866 RepID=UPI00048F25AB|nr:hypothetical protein [Nocardioides sp. J54]